MDPIVTSSIVQAGAGTANALINQAFAEHNRERNYYWNEKAADSADKRQREQYQDLYSPQAQMDQYAAAGLSPSMMMSGGQSAVGGTPQGAQGGINGAYPSGNIIDPIAAAQIANINADTKLKEQEAINIGAETEFTMANIIKAAEETENYKQRNMLLMLDKEKLQLEIDLQKATNPEVIKQCIEKSEQMYLTTEQLIKENKALDLQNQLDESTMQTRINQAAQEYKTELAETALKWANVNLTEQQIQSLIDNVAIQRQNANTNEFNSRTQRLEINATIQQWAKENGYTEEKLKLENTKNWLNFATNIFSSICNLAGSIGSAALKAAK